MSDQKKFKIKREHFGQDFQKRETTLGTLTRPDGSHFGYTLEDVVRASGIKVNKTTAIPATKEGDTYKMTVRESEKYGQVVVIYTRYENGVYHLDYDGVSFTYILFHGGNFVTHTAGCVLVNESRDVRDGHMSAWGSLKDEMVTEVKRLESEGYDVRLDVKN